MNSIKDILRRKKTSPKSKARLEIDSMTVAKISQEAVVLEVKSLSSDDIQEVYYKKEKKIIIIKTVHPAVASEIWRKRNAVVKMINKLVGKEIVEKITLK